MENKKMIASVTGIAMVGVLSYLGYRVLKQLNDMTFDDFIGENLEGEYYYRSEGCPGPKGDEGSSKP